MSMIVLADHVTTVALVVMASTDSRALVVMATEEHAVRLTLTNVPVHLVKMVRIAMTMLRVIPVPVALDTKEQTARMM